MISYAYLIIPLGAIVGTVFRWKISVAYNSLIPFIPVGTLIVNLVGSYLIGYIMGIPITVLPSLIKSWIAIGFLGGLTTFSAFSAEVVVLLSAHEYKYAVLLITCHVLGSIVMTMLGMYTGISMFAK